MRFSEYSFVRPMAGLGPRGFAIEPLPFPHATTSWSPTTSNADGYQPAGMRPASLSLPAAVATPDVTAERSNTATAFASASATNRRVPSFESDKAFGVAPSPGPAGGG